MPEREREFVHMLSVSLEPSGIKPRSIASRTHWSCSCLTALVRRKQCGKGIWDYPETRSGGPQFPTSARRSIRCACTVHVRCALAHPFYFVGCTQGTQSRLHIPDDCGKAIFGFGGNRTTAAPNLEVDNHGGCQRIRFDFPRVWFPLCMCT